MIAVGAYLAPASAQRQTYTPLPQDVVARVPSRSSDPVAREISRLHAVIRASGANPEATLRAARLHMEEARRSADPRHFGYAEAVLRPLCDGPNPNAEALVLRGMVHQSRHHFVVALADLDKALALRPQDAQAWLVRASIFNVLGKYEEAEQSCAALAEHATPFIALACRAPIDGVRGNAKLAAKRLSEAVSNVRNPGERAWAASLLGELATWVGDTTTAEAQLRQALSLDPGDRYSRGIYADLLLEDGRAHDARALLAETVDDEALLVRLAIADQVLGLPTASERRRVLRERFDADRRRGEPVHAREEARFTLFVEKEPVRALALALENWDAQHEPWDARLVLEAALAARQPEAARPVLAWVKSTGFEDPRLRDLSGRLEQM